MNAAQKAEKERIARLNEQKKRFAEDPNKQFVLDREAEIPVEIDPTLSRHLKPHQISGIQFLVGSFL